ncbi:MAG: PIN domain-containing protein [Candidatus Omnitrophica bacterium]|nr:PIN domain-containing protein [Candidatus Omnitrophota bacterium]
MTPRYTGTYLLDASALLAYAGEEPGFETVQALLESAKEGRCRLLIPPIAVMEASVEVWLEEGEEAVGLLYGRLAGLPIQQAQVDEQVIWLAGQMKALHSLSTAEAWLFAAAKRHQATVVHKDPAFDKLHELAPLLSLCGNS